MSGALQPRADCGAPSSYPVSEPENPHLDRPLRSFGRIKARPIKPRQAALMDTGLVDHHRVDGFRYQPVGAVDWMVCDMVEQPRKVAERMATWFREGWCRNAVFNLKLPMKKRWQETLLALDLFANNAGEHDNLVIRARQLYHDREEITVYASVE